MSARVYVGDLGSDGSKPELEKEFEQYGSLKSVWIARNPPGFAFVEFHRPEDAEESVRALDGKKVCGVQIRVEMAKANNRAPSTRGGYRQRSPHRYRSRSPERQYDRQYRSPDRRYRSPDRRYRSPDRRYRSPDRKYGYYGRSPTPPYYRREYSPRRYY